MTVRLAHLRSVVSFMHCKSYCHRDIKPENILLRNDEEFSAGSYAQCFLQLQQPQQQLACSIWKLAAQCGTKTGNNNWNNYWKCLHPRTRHRTLREANFHSDLSAFEETYQLGDCDTVKIQSFDWCQTDTATAQSRDQAGMGL